MKTLKELAQEAINVQDACNLSGVVHGFSRAISNLRELYPNKGTDWYNQHFISILWADKIASLTGITTYTDAFGRAYAFAYKTADGEDCADNW